jgi:hypothetical protein
MQKSNDFRIEVIINDKPITMNPFVQDIVTNVVYALVQSLKLEDQPEKIEVTLTKS